MKHTDLWVETKFILDKKGKLKTSSNRKHLQVASRVIAKLVADFYQENISIHVTGDLIDMGCGRVPLYQAYQQYADSITCVDWDNALTENIHIDFSVDLNSDLPMATNSYDTIILSAVLEHIRDPQHLWSEMYRILRPRGKVILNVPYFYWLHAEPYDYYRYTKYALQYLAEKSGFEVSKVDALGGVPDIFVDIIGRIFNRIPVLGTPLIITFQSFLRLLHMTSFGRKASSKSAQRFPLCYGMIVQK